MEEGLIQVNRVHRIDGESKLKAFVDISFGGWTIKGWRIVEGKNGLFLGLPQELGKDGRWYSTVRPDSKEIHQELAEKVLKFYQEETE